MTDVHSHHLEQQQPQPQPARAAAPSDSKQLAGHLRVRQTQARPNRTLFGSVLERLSDADLAAAAAAVLDCNNSSTTERRQQQERLPPELAAFVRERHAPEIERHTRDVEDYRRRLKLRDQRIGLMERDSKYVFDLPPHPVETLRQVTAPARNYGPRPRWMTADDLSHAAEVNPHFLAPGVASFNRDKYQRLPESHSYALAGDPLRPGMDFDRAPVELPPLPPPNLPFSYARPDRLVMTPRTEQRQLAMRRLPPSFQTINGVQVPMRLKHQFGSELCEELLADRDAVLASSRRMQQRDQRYRPSDVASNRQPLETGNPSYEQLGNALRTNVFGQGYSVNQRVSSNHEDFSRDQFAQREPAPDGYRYKKDHVSRWAEANVLEMRMKKALQERMDRMLHKKADD